MMKKLFIHIVALVYISGVFAQSPEKMSYQAVVRNNSNQLETNKAIGMQISILHGTVNGTAVYVETQTSTTNANGLVTVEIGEGIVISGSFTTIDWANGPYFIKTETDPNGGTNYTITGTSQLLSVPYALYAKTAENGFSGDYNDLTNIPTLFDGDYYSLMNAPQLFSGEYADLAGKPTTLEGYGITNAMSTSHVANGITSVNITDWNTAFDWGNHAGLYRPIDWVPAWTDVAEKPGFAVVATSGSYDDLMNKPSFNVLTDATLAGDGTTVSPLKIAQQSATNGQVLKWNGTTWLPGTDQLGSSLWSQNGSNIYFNSGNVGIGTNNPGTKLEVLGSARINGILFMQNQNISNLANPVNDQDAATKAYVDGSSSGNWKTTGNAGINPATNFMGTTDNIPVVFRVNNQERMRLNHNGNLTFSGTGASVFIGEGAGLNDDLTDNRNVFVGAGAGNSNTTGNNNTANGSQALALNTTGTGNSANGYQALHANTTGNYNTANGNKALNSNITGWYNTACGSSALESNISGANNTAYGLAALNYNTTGNNNTADGFSALYHNTTGYSNIAIGINTLHQNTTRSNLVAVGDSALYHNGLTASISYHGTGNTAMGSKALFSNSTGYCNTANGYQTLYYNTTGNHNTANGYHTLYLNTTGTDNTAVGMASLISNTTGYVNTATGANALYYNSTGWGNTANGEDALHKNTTGNSNTAVGQDAGYDITTGSNNTAIGYFAQVPSSTASNQVRIGNTNVTYAGIQVAWTVTSDIKWKESVRDLPYGLDFVNKLKPVDYVRKNNENKTRETGFIAQDVEALFNEMGIKNNGLISKGYDGSLELRYNDFIPILTKAIQEQQVTIDLLQKQNEELQAKLSKLNDLEVKISELDQLKAEIESIK
jgi:hypothetical protein